MFVVSTLFHRIITCNEFEFAASQHYSYDIRKSSFPDFQGIFMYFPDFTQNLKFPSPNTKFPDFSQTLNFPDFSLTSGNHDVSVRGENKTKRHDTHSHR